MKLNWKKILLVCAMILTISFGTFLLLDKMGYNLKTLSTDSGFDADYGGSDYGESDYGGSDYGGGYDSGFDYDYGGSNGSGRNRIISFEEFLRIPLIFAAFLIPATFFSKAAKYIRNVTENEFGNFLVSINGILYFVSACFGLMFAAVLSKFTLIMYVITMLPSIIICLVLRNKQTYSNNKNVINNYKDISNDDLKKINYNNIDELKTEIYNNYVAIQIAWMNNSIEDVRHLLSDVMFNMYESQLFTLSTKKQQNIMSDFKYMDAKIYNIKKISNGFIIETTLDVICKDYIINKDTKKVLRGSSNHKRHYLYSLKFKIGTKTVETCPSCHAKLPDQGSSVKCSYCGSKVVRNSNNLVLIEKKMLKQNIVK